MKLQHPTSDLPPRRITKFLKMLLAPHVREEVLGDLQERYVQRVQSQGVSKARRRYWLETLAYMRPAFIKRQKNKYSSTGRQSAGRHSAGRQTAEPSALYYCHNMILNYLKIALRNLKRQKVSTSINVIGLAIGLATCILIMLYVQDELSYDRYNEKADRIFRVAQKVRLNGDDVGGPTLGQSAATDLKQQVPEVLKATRFRGQGGEFVSYGTSSFKEDNLLVADSSFFDVFSIPFLKGNPKRALTEPNTVVITDETARKYFGNDDPIGKVLSFGREKIPYRITGVVSNVPASSHFRFDMLASFAADEEEHAGWIYRMNYYTYVLLEHHDFKKVEAKIARLAEKQIGGELQQWLKLTPEQFRAKGDDFGILLQPLTGIHLYSAFGTAELSPGGNIMYVYVLSAIAAFMLLIACVNFMNLSTATAVRRSREVGVRKVLGSVKGQLRQQFLIESLLLAIVALLVGLLIVAVAMPFFNQLTSKTLTMNLLTNSSVVAGLIVGTVLVGLLAGSYPAFYLASFKPVLVLKGGFSAGHGNFNLRSGLVVFQFFVTISMIIATVTADRQLRYMQSQKVGAGDPKYRHASQ
jgi:putative ABC transport system permease protein